MRKNILILIGLLIVILSILALIANPIYQGLIIKIKMAELYTTVNTITKAEEGFFIKHGFYASCDEINEHRGYFLPYAFTREDIARFAKVLGIKIPGVKSVFIYGVYYDPAQIFVRVREHPGDPVDKGWWVLCSIPLTGADKGKWVIHAYNPWSKYLQPPAKTIIDYSFVNK